MQKSFVWALAALFVGTLTSGAWADHLYAPSYDPAYSAPVPVAIDSVYAPSIYAPVVYAAPVYVRPIYVARPVVVARPVYVSAPVVRVIPTTIVRDTLIVRPYSTTYSSHSHGWGLGHNNYHARQSPHRTVIRSRGR